MGQVRFPYSFHKIKFIPAFSNNQSTVAFSSKRIIQYLRAKIVAVKKKKKKKMIPNLFKKKINFTSERVKKKKL